MQAGAQPCALGLSFILLLRGWSITSVQGGTVGTRTLQAWELLLSAIRKTLQSPRHGGTRGWGRDEGISAG